MTRCGVRTACSCRVSRVLPTPVTKAGTSSGGARSSASPIRSPSSDAHHARFPQRRPPGRGFRSRLDARRVRRARPSVVATRQATRRPAVVPGRLVDDESGRVRQPAAVRVPAAHPGRPAPDPGRWPAGLAGRCERGRAAAGHPRRRRARRIHRADRRSAEPRGGNRCRGGPGRLLLRLLHGRRVPGRRPEPRREQILVAGGWIESRWRAGVQRFGVC